MVPELVRRWVAGVSLADLIMFLNSILNPEATPNDLGDQESAASWAADALGSEYVTAKLLSRALVNQGLHPLKRLALAAFLLDSGEQFVGETYEFVTMLAQDAVESAYLAFDTVLKDSSRSTRVADKNLGNHRSWLALAIVMTPHLYPFGDVRFAERYITDITSAR